MDAGVVVAIVAVAVTVGGGVWKLISGRFKELRAQIDKLIAAAEADEKTIAVLQRQVDRFEITAQIQDKFFSGLPRRGDSG